MTHALLQVAWWVGLVAILLVALRRLSIWWIDSRPRTLDEAHLAARFRGLILFGLDGASLSFRSIGSPLLVRWTRRVAADGTARFSVELRAASLSEAELEGLLERVGRLSGGRLELNRHGAGRLEGRVEGPLAQDHDALESATRSIVSALGVDRSEKFRFECGGPRDERAVADHFRRGGRLSQNRS